MKYTALLITLVLTPIALGTEDQDECIDLAQRYVFSWPISEGCDDKPRGGSSKGDDVQISAKPHAGWLSIQSTKQSKFEKDRAAILAMAGGYKVNFDFLETVGFSTGFRRDKPYRSWGTEYVYIVEDTANFISLQHIMVMYFKQADGSVSEPFVMKHWRQDWTFEDALILEYDHRNTWRKKELAASDIKGTWSQAVFQVDDSPRYESVGRWTHNGSFSSWVSAKTRRPLPRRESSIRDDYQVLEGYNRHTITRFGWTQEEENWKLVIDENGIPDSATPYLSKEIGMARYQPVENVDFTPGDEYMSKTGSFWQQVRALWSSLIDKRLTIKLRSSVDNKPLFVPLFNRAEKIDNIENVVDSQDSEFIQKTVLSYVVD